MVDKFFFHDTFLLGICIRIVLHACKRGRCGLTGACKWVWEYGMCRPRSLFDSTCSCSSTASPDGSTRTYPSLISRPQPAFHHL